MELEENLDMSHRRARETVLEAVRIDLLSEEETSTEPVYTTTNVGSTFLSAIQSENWGKVSQILATRSPHYGAFVDAVDELEHADLGTLLEQLETEQEFTPYSFNQTGVEVVGDWGERLGRVQRNAFTGSYYPAAQTPIPNNFHFILLDVYDELEQTAGVDLRQRYLSIPRLREVTCERLRCTREAFNEALLALCQQNIGKLELSGAPLDTGAKNAALGIKQISLAHDDGLVSTSQSSQQVMTGVEQFGKLYYYLAVHDRDITFTQEDYS
ncbi:hypothetical protein C483_02186 [Natrialba hulunbeirensis JCM 10989]|uniref:Uncharacterized protein n=1 Tax=Natrialba hulunbeirensis JCM 10989 TaxID=1227493 RepID=M0A8P9_9EURY|nr:hypothetical protein C483_02186 [Natrialba hulunbeirensis JCM 10989]